MYKCKILNTKFETRNPKSETNSKLEFSNVQNIRLSLEYDFLRFGHLRFRNLFIVSIFDIRISDFVPCVG